MKPKNARERRQLRAIFPHDPDKWYCVYLIGDAADIKALRLDRLYVGISGQPYQRFIDHGNSGANRFSRNVYQAIREFGWTYEENCEILGYFPEEKCKYWESRLRPIANMGLNVAPGGLKEYRDFIDPDLASYSAKNALLELIELKATNAAA